ncbi:hypothetical protein H0A36_14675 [Endozoicomonas sp. SM1973]|uniref:Uncharacterized protein n=1 Tax=Spartinivicinus marinus TaxID=2994442 RepID=A0A853HZW1_9GAMM|nr:hypothetical protein [Spartinivicinus marinus]MCX4026395.1 hypothetical protein [Spartinivicinus marinus]NYZ67260.1 hypothetical protein [Spartinivicinus marinus]
MKHKISVSKHDTHNLEIKSLLIPKEKKEVSDVAFYFIAPRTLGISNLNKEEAYSYISSRVRLALSSKSLKSQISDQSSFLNTAIQNQKDDLKVIRKLGAYWWDIIKKQTKIHTKIINRLTQETNPGARSKSILQLTNDIEQITETNKKIWEACLSLPNPEHRLNLATFLNYVNIRYIYSIKNNINKNSLNIDKDTVHIDNLLRKLTYEESCYSKQAQLNTDLANEKEAEDYLIKISKLKKYFQSEMFVDTKNNKVAIKRLKEPIAVFSAILAAICGFTVEKVAASNWEAISRGGLYLMALGIIGYAIRDRLKDRIKLVISNCLSNYFPDRNIILDIQNNKIGFIKEWFHLTDSSTLPNSVHQLRYSKLGSKIDKYQPEDIIHLRYLYTINLQNEIQNTGYELQNIIRINMGRYFENLDEAYKEIPSFTKNNEVVSLPTRRLYNIYLIAEIKQCEKAISNVAFKIAIDKEGVRSVEKLYINK